MNRVVLLGLAMVFMACVVFADETAQQARNILAEHGKKVVVVELVISETSSTDNGGSDEYEYNMETFGTVISADGLIVCSLMAIDPSVSMEASSAGAMQLETKVKSAKVIFDDNQEKEAQIVLRDKDLDLAFMRLKEKPESPLPYIDLSVSGKAEMFDEVLFINRLGKIAKRMPSATFSRILGIVEKPRFVYFVGGYSGEGEAAFSLDGKLLGILLSRVMSTDGIDEEGPEMTGVIVPAATILEVAAQAPSIEKASADAEKAPPAPEKKLETPAATGDKSAA